MAQYQYNTVYYGWETYTGSAIASDDNYIFPAKQIYIPETDSRTFLGGYLEFNIAQSGSAAISISAIRAGCTYTAGSNTLLTRYTGSSNVASTTDHWTATYIFPITGSSINSFFTGSSISMQPQIRLTGPITLGHTVNVVLSYKFKENPNHAAINTAIIPIDSRYGLVPVSPNTGSRLGPRHLHQIPKLSTYLPEAGKRIRNIYFEAFYSNGRSTAGVPYSGSFIFDFGTKQTIRHNNSLGTGRSHREIYDLTTMNTGSTHWVDVKNGPIAQHISNPGGLLYVTYEYDKSVTTRRMRRISIPYLYTRANDAVFTNTTFTSSFSFMIAENNPIAMQSAMIHRNLTQINTAYYFSCGKSTHPSASITSRNYASASFAVAGINSSYDTTIMRVDTGSFARSVSAASVWSVVKGINTYPIISFSSNTQAPLINTIFLINYTSDTASNSVYTGNSNVVVPTMHRSNDTVAVGSFFPISQPSSSVYYNSIYHDCVATTATNFASLYLATLYYLISGSFNVNQGTIVSNPVSIASMANDSEMGSLRGIFPIAIDNLYSELPLTHITSIPIVGSPAAANSYSYNTLIGNVSFSNRTFMITGSIINYRNVGSNPPPIYITNKTTGDILYSTTASAAGSTRQIRAHWYDDWNDLAVYCVSGSKIYSSNIGRAGIDTFTIDMSTGSASQTSSEFAFTFIG